MSNTGFVPCFHCYLHKEYPIANVYCDTSYIKKVKTLFSTIFDHPDPRLWKNDLGGKCDIQPVRPDSAESKRPIKLCHSPHPLYRLDFGNTPFRILLSLDNKQRLAYFHMLDVHHSTASGKHKKPPRGGR